MELDEMNHEEVEETEEETTEEVTEEGEVTTKEDEKLTTEDEGTAEEYADKIAELDERLDKYRTDKLDDIKIEKMRQANYTDEQIERYSRHVVGDNVEEIERSLSDLRGEIPPKRRYVDPSLGATRAGGRIATNDNHYEVGRKMFDRVKDKITRRF